MTTQQDKLNRLGGTLARMGAMVIPVAERVKGFVDGFPERPVWP
jgi:hypothetical protein